MRTTGEVLNNHLMSFGKGYINGILRLCANIQNRDTSHLSACETATVRNPLKNGMCPGLVPISATNGVHG